MSAGILSPRSPRSIKVLSMSPRSSPMSCPLARYARRYMKRGVRCPAGGFGNSPYLASEIIMKNDNNKTYLMAVQVRAECSPCTRASSLNALHALPNDVSY